MSVRIAVVTPYFREPRDVLWQCHRSVLDQQVGTELFRAEHFLIADGHPLAEIDDWTASHVRLPSAHGDNGNTPRGLGSLLAKAEGYDFIAYLDADNWFHAGHLASLLALHRQTGSPVCSAIRTFHDLAGNRLEVSETDEDALRHVDTSCVLIHRSSFDLIGVWLDMPRMLSPICDRVFLAAILHNQRSVRSTGQRSVAFRTQYASHYRAAGAPVPQGAKDADHAGGVLAYLVSPQGVTECVQALGFWPATHFAMAWEMETAMPVNRHFPVAGSHRPAGFPQ